MTQARLSLDLALNRNRTVLNVVRQEPPWRALRAFQNASGEALVHLHNVSGGILGGDHLQLEVRVQPRAQAQITAVGATRIYRSGGGDRAASQTTQIHVGEDALLEYLPDTVIPYAHSRFAQTSEIHLGKGAGLIWWETLSAGRIASGERFAFDRLSVETSIYARGMSIALERYTLHPASTKFSSPARFGKYLYSTTMYVCREGRPVEEWLTLEQDLNLLANSLSADGVKWGASALVSDGALIRGMAQDASGINEGLRAMWHTAKQKVFGRPALLPRKIY